MTSKTAAFSLIELLLTIAMLLTIGTLTSIYLSRYLLANASQSTADYLANTLRKAQSYAMSGKNNSRWGVTIVSGNVVLFQGSSYASRDTIQDQTYALNPNVTIAGMTETIFHKDTGTPSGTLSLTIAVPGTVRNLTLNNQGIVDY